MFVNNFETLEKINCMCKIMWKNEVHWEENL